MCSAGKQRLLDYLVGGGEQCRRNREAECLRRVQIYDEIELCRLLDRNVGRLRPAKKSYRRNQRRAEKDPGSLVQRKSDLPLLCNLEIHESSAVARRPPVC